LRPCYARCKGWRREEFEILRWLGEIRKERIGKGASRDGIAKSMHGELRGFEPDQVVDRERLVPRDGSPGRLEAKNWCTISHTGNTGDEVEARTVRRIDRRESTARRYAETRIAPVPGQRGGLGRGGGESGDEDEGKPNRTMESRR